jgi:HD-GYP domain-containing protein (c-di-GMP phosphodiesterase class II)
MPDPASIPLQFSNGFLMQVPEETIEIGDALGALAIMGDLSMGQPIDHSQRVAILSAALASHLGWRSESIGHVREIAQLRWSGCTANAAEFATTISDDVGGRALMLQLQFEEMVFLVPPDAMAEKIALVSSIHCDVSCQIANSLGLHNAVSEALGCVFERWDGTGSPNALRGEAIPQAAMLVAACSELEIFTRLHGLPKALTFLRQRAQLVYPGHLVDAMEKHAQQWFEAIHVAPDVPNDRCAKRQIKMGLVGHVIDLKLPWLLGHSRSVEKLAGAIAASMGVAPERRTRLRRAAWLHGLGRVSVPNAIWDRKGALTTADMERVRLAPYWTSRVGNAVAGLADAAETAAHAYERLDGSGYFRGIRSNSIPIESRILATALAWVAMVSDRPWRKAMRTEVAMAEIQRGSAAGLFDPQTVSSLLRCVAPQALPQESKVQTPSLLTARELEVLQRVSLGDSNKEAAQSLGISPSTVRTHMESIFFKLGCKTRAACTLRASLLGLLNPF